MTASVKKWGNSLALRIPKPLAEEVGLYKDAPVTLALEEGRLVIAPILRTRHVIESLLAQVTEQNLHADIDTGEAVGREAW